MDPQHRRFHPPGRKIWHRRQGSQGEAIAQLDRSFSRRPLALGPLPSDFTQDGHPLAAKLLYLDLPKDMPGADAHGRVSVGRCKSCANQHDTFDLLPFQVTGPYVAGVESLPFCTINNGKASCGHRGNANRTSCTLANASSNTGPVRSCNLDR